MSEPPATQNSRVNASTTYPLPSASARTNSQPVFADTSTASSSSVGRIPDSQFDVLNEGDEDHMDLEVEPTPSLKPVKLKAGLEKKPKLAEYACTPYEVSPVFSIFWM